ncbi:MAG: hypothetical protein ACRC0X_09770 [Brevinema sp.]
MTNIITNLVTATNIEKITITNLIIQTNTLNKIDIMNIPTDWNVLSVTIIGALATIISAGVMLWTVRKMEEQNRLSTKSLQDRKKYGELEHLMTLYFITDEIKREYKKSIHMVNDKNKNMVTKQYIIDTIDVLRSGSVLYFEILSSEKIKLIYQYFFDELFIDCYPEYMDMFKYLDVSTDSLAKFYQEYIDMFKYSDVSTNYLEKYYQELTLRDLDLYKKRELP